jgi:hypothetical protein
MAEVCDVLPRFAIVPMLRVDFASEAGHFRE